MSTRRIKVKLAVWAFLLLICLMASNGIASDTTGVTSDEVRVGLLFATTGPASALSVPVVEAIMTIINQTNEVGGVHGRKIKAFIEDDANNPEKTKSAVKKLIYDTKVFSILGTGGGSIPAFVAKKEIEEAKVPWLAGPAVMDKIYVPTVPTTFCTTLTGGIAGKAMARLMMTAPSVKKIAFVYHYNDWGKGLLESATNELEKHKTQKVEWIAEVVENNITDATPVVLKVKKYNPDFVAAFLYPVEGAVFVRDAYKYGLREIPIVGAPSLTDLKDLRARSGIPESMKWVFAATASTYCESNISDPRYSDLATALKKYFPQARIHNMNFLGFGSARILIEALRRSGRDLTREKFLDALESLKDFDTGVLASRITYSKTSHLGIEDCIFLTLKKDGTEYFLDKSEWDTNILKKKNWE